MVYEIGQTCMLVNLGLTRSECASWVQAWGSLLAVMGAAVGIWWQARVQARHRIEELRRIENEHEKARVAEEVRRLTVIAGAFFKCIGALKRIELASRERSTSAIEREMDALLQQIDLMLSIPALDVPDLYAAYAIAEAKSVFTTLQAGLRTAAADTRIVLNIPAEDRLHYFRTPHLNAALDNFLALEQTVKASLQQRGSDLPAQTITLNDVILHSTR